MDRAGKFRAQGFSLVKQVCQTGVNAANGNHATRWGAGIRIQAFCACIMVRSINIKRHGKDYPKQLLPFPYFTFYCSVFNSIYMCKRGHTIQALFWFYGGIFSFIFFHSYSLCGVRSIMVSVISTPFSFLMYDRALSSSDKDCACISITMSQRPLDV